MLVTGSNRFFLNPKESETLVKMVKIGSIVEIEEGEISDTESVEEISEEDFKQEARVLKPKEETTRTTWMGDLLKFPLSNNYASGLHNFAWAQAVQNKPLNEMMMVRDLGSEEKPMRSASKIVANSRGNNSKSSNSSSKEVWNLIIVDSGEETDSKMEDVGCGKDDEKEEGELEEGEIEMDMEVVEENTQEGISNSSDNLLDMSENTQRDLKESEFEKRLNSIREAIETVTAEEAEKSFHEGCSRLLLNLESLQLMVLESRIPNMDALIQQFFTGIQAINSVFGSMNPEQQEHNKDVFSRLLTYVKSQDPALSSPEQIKEIEEMLCSLQSQSVSSSIKPMDMEKESTKAMANEVDRRVLNDSGILAENCCDDLTALKKSQLEPVSVKSEDHNKVSTSRWTVAAENCCDDLNALKTSQLESVSVKSKDHNKVSMSRWTVAPGLAFGSLGGLVKEKESINDSGILAENHCHDLNAPPGMTFGSLGGLVKEKESINDSGILAENECHYLNASKKFQLEPVSIKFEDHNNVDTSLGTSRPGLPFSSKSRGVLVPMLDLHSDHDADSLPSPTRATASPLSIQKPWAISEKTVRSDLATTKVAEKTTPPLPIQKPRAVGDETVRSDLATTKVAEKTEDATTLHLYETDALKAVSTYQQKFGRTSFLSSNRLPSPTPSEECDDGDDDTSGEVCSSFTVGNVRTVNTSIPLQPMGSATLQTDSSSGQVLVPAKTFGQSGSALGPILRAPAKSRDPRLRYANSDPGALNLNQRSLSVDYNAPRNEPLEGMMSSRKHKIFEESVLDGHTLKRQRNGLANSVVSRDAQMVSPSGGWLEEKNTMGPQLSNRNHVMGTDPRKLGNGEIGIGKRQDTSSGNFNVTIGVSEQLPVTGIGKTAPLPSLLNDIAVNPTMLMQLIKLEQQRLATEAQQKSCNPAPNIVHSSSSNVTQGAVPLVNVSSSKSSEPDQKPASKPQIPSQSNSTNSENERGKIRMKPRDPRRILHSNTFQKSERLGPEQFRTNDAPPSSTQDKKDNLIVRQQGEQAETNSLPSQSAPPPDIARQFTKKLKNIADILSASQAVSEPPIDPQVVSSQPMSVKADKLDVRAIGTDVNDQKSGANLMPEESTAVPPRAQNTWGDVEHLFEGYDDQQKAAIQRERTRRIEEQNKMFAARKLCLVLDLDHTLLNSAKFVEVDPVHDEILRKKEEQDKEKPYRHLFRFPHMGMWTKLRPGIWNFLEKASKLFELHLYTMGNKLYATEMAKVIDPTGILFAGRVISKGDDGDPLDSDERLPKTKDLEGVLGMESAVVIVDDSVRVWPHNKLNLIVVERYTYFPCSRRQFGLPGPSLLEIDHDERPEEGTLASSLAVIERIHQIFFSHRSLSEVDVRNILASEQRKILAGCHILFSRVFPLGEANPHLHPLWQTAEQFGGVCTNQIDEQVTHVVANSPGTDKVNWALSTGRFVVHPGWVEASALLYRRANELDFAVKL